VVARSTVLDTQPVNQPVIDQIFTFTEPAGSYSISGADSGQQTVAIEAGTTSTVQIDDTCK
jgi:hypothetical protein